jgi:HEPN domain-containing protein
MALSDADIRAKQIAGYLGAAARDLKVAELIADSRDPDLASTAANHVQQCAEKVAKAVFIARGVTVTKEHRLVINIETLLKAVPDEPWAEKLKPLAPYDDYATTSRYPSTMGKLSAGPAPDELDDDIEKVRRLLTAARTEFMADREPSPPRRTRP